MNISQHAIVPFSPYYRGYYDSNKVMQSTNISTIKSSLYQSTLGLNSFFLFSLYSNSTSATLKLFDPYLSFLKHDGIITFSDSLYFSVQLSLESIPFVRVILFSL